jgi:hypothetical protein
MVKLRPRTQHTLTFAERLAEEAHISLDYTKKAPFGLEGFFAYSLPRLASVRLLLRSPRFWVRVPLSFTPPRLGA